PAVATPVSAASSTVRPSRCWCRRGWGRATAASRTPQGLWSASAARAERGSESWSSPGVGADGKLRLFRLLLADQAVTVAVQFAEQFQRADELAQRHVTVAVAVHVPKPRRPLFLRRRGSGRLLDGAAGTPKSLAEADAVSARQLGPR